MKVLLLNGSPNAQGCTFTALSEVAATLNDGGVEAEIIQVGHADLGGLHCLPQMQGERPLCVRRSSQRGGAKV